MQATALESIIIKPAFPAQSSVIWLHGLGADGNDFAPIVPELRLPENLGTRFVFPHAPVLPVTINGGLPMRAWFDLYGITPDSPQDEVGIKLAHESISLLIENEINLGIPSDKIILAGFSQGGAMALYSGLNFSKPLAGILALSTFLPSNYYWNQNAVIHNCAPIFMAHGKMDNIVGYYLGKASHDRLLQLGCKVEWHDYPMEHSVCMEEIQDISHWITKTLSASSEK